MIVGVIDSGADITIIGGEQVATVAKLRKKDFRSADKTPRTYDQRPFVLHGCMDLDITFGGKTMSTPIYVKMDSSTPLLLSIDSRGEGWDWKHMYRSAAHACHSHVHSEATKIKHKQR